MQLCGNRGMIGVKQESNKGKRGVQRGYNKGKTTVKKHKTEKFCNEMGYDDQATVERQLYSITDYKLDAIDAITLDIHVYSITDYKFGCN